LLVSLGYGPTHTAHTVYTSPHARGYTLTAGYAHGYRAFRLVYTPHMVPVYTRYVTFCPVGYATHRTAVHGRAHVLPFDTGCWFFTATRFCLTTLPRTRAQPVSHAYLRTLPACRCLLRLVCTHMHATRAPCRDTGTRTFGFTHALRTHTRTRLRWLHSWFTHTHCPLYARGSWFTGSGHSYTTHTPHTHAARVAAAATQPRGFCGTCLPVLNRHWHSAFHTLHLAAAFTTMV